MLSLLNIWALKIFAQLLLYPNLENQYNDADKII